MQYRLLYCHSCLLFLSFRETEALVAPEAKSVAAVDAWLASHNIKSGVKRSPAGDWLFVSVPVARAEKMLNTRVGYVFSLSKATPPVTYEKSPLNF